MSIENEKSEAKQVKIGVIISYILIVCNTLYGLLVTPYLVSGLGEAEYGVYKTISSFTASLMVLDLGMGGTVMRYISKYRANKENDKIPNFVAMMLVQATVVCVAVGLVSLGLYGALDPMYSSSFTPEQLSKAKLLFALFAIMMLLTIFQNVINGVITGSNRFLFGNGIKLVKFLLRTVLVVGALYVTSNSVAIVTIEIILVVLFIFIELFYIVFKLKIRPRLTRWDKTVFFESGKYTLMMFLTTIVAQVNNGLDNVIIGAVKGPELVTVYSMGLLIFTMYENLSTSISGAMLPTVSNIIASDGAKEKLENLIVKVGRVQFVLLGSATIGFAVVGSDFISLWLGEGFEDVYIITLILMIPSLFELCVNVCLSILRAKNMLTFRTVTIILSTVLNLVVTLVLVNTFSYIGAAIGTAVSFVVGSLIVMNIYYVKKLGLPMLKIYLGIFKRIWLCLFLAGAAIFLSSRFLYGNILSFIANVAIFMVVYLASLLSFGFSREEKLSLPIVNKFFKNKGDIKND